MSTLLGVTTHSPTANADDRLCGAAQLARGYQAAFEEMNDTSVSIQYWNAGKVETIEKVRRIHAFGGTLLIRNISGQEQILNATKVIKISEE
ncbi:MAG: hypothetical protein AAFY98_07715 [Verrucomicrobiota bacterium]